MRIVTPARLTLAAALISGAAMAQLTPPPAPVPAPEPRVQTQRPRPAPPARATMDSLMDLRQAQQEIARGRWAAANEAVEMAETRALTRSVIAGTEGTPAAHPVLTETQAAREAIARRDRATASARIEAAIRLIEAEPAGM
jgi:hypothetical protein